MNSLSQQDFNANHSSYAKSMEQATINNNRLSNYAEHMAENEKITKIGFFFITYNNPVFSFLILINTRKYSTKAKTLTAGKTPILITFHCIMTVKSMFRFIIS